MKYEPIYDVARDAYVADDLVALAETQREYRLDIYHGVGLVMWRGRNLLVETPEPKPVPFWDDPAIVADIFGPDPCKYAPAAIRRFEHACRSHK